MIFGLADRVQETSITIGIGNFVLAGATTGYRTFLDALGDGAPCAYVIAVGSEWETGIGVIHSPDTLSRETVLSSSNSGALVNFSAGTKTVFISQVAAFQDAMLATAGEDILVRDAVRIEIYQGFGTGGTVFKCDAMEAAKSSDCYFAGFATHAALEGKPILIRTAGILEGFLSLTAGAPYYLSNTAGEIIGQAPANKRLVAVAMTDTAISINSAPGISVELVADSPTIGLFGGGNITSSATTADSVSKSEVVDYLDLVSKSGNAAARGGGAEVSVASYGAVGSADDSFFCGGVVGFSTITASDIIQVGDRYVTDGFLLDTGDLSLARSGLSGVAYATRGFVAGGQTSSAVSNVIDFINFSTFTTSSADAGDLTVARSYLGAAAAASVGFFAGGLSTVPLSLIDKIDMTTGTQNAVDRGDLTERKQSLVGLSSANFATFAGGFNGALVAVLECLDTFTYSSIAMDRGELTLARFGLGASSDDEFHGALAGGTNGLELNIIENVDSDTISVNVSERGELSYARTCLAGN